METTNLWPAITDDDRAERLIVAIQTAVVAEEGGKAPTATKQGFMVPT